MTREEAKNIFSYENRYTPEQYDSKVDSIYDDFENRSCNNCKWYDKELNKKVIGMCRNTKSPVEWIGSMYSENKQCLNFNCNKWESKND